MHSSSPKPFQINDSNQATPKHEQLREHLVLEIKEGRLRPGDVLPTETELALAGKMARNTVRQALSELERNGMIRRVPGRGTFVHETASDRIKSRSAIFALLVPDTRTGYYPSLQRGFYEASAGLDSQVIVCNTDNDPCRQADFLLQLLDKKVAGVALVPTVIAKTPAYHVRPLHDRGIPVVFCHRRVQEIQAPLITFPALEVGRLAGETMLDQGHRRVAFISGQRSKLSEQYEQGLRRALQSRGTDLPDEFVCYDNAIKVTPEHERFVQAKLEEVLRFSPRPTAIFCTFDSEAELVYLLLTKLGIRVPDDISLIGFGGRWRQGAFAQRLTSITVDEEELGRQAVRLLSVMGRGQLALNDMTDIMMPLGLNKGETLRKSDSAKDTSRNHPFLPGGIHH